VTLGDIYAAHVCSSLAIAPHLPRLRALASECRHVMEFGVKRGASSSALLMGASVGVTSYDVIETPEARALEVVAGEMWHYRIGSSLAAPRVECDMLFIDSLHTYAQCKAELDRHADSVMRYLVFHDSLTFGSIGADGETGRHSWSYVPGQSVPVEHLGIRPAIDELMIRDPAWGIAAHYTDSHGLLVLERER
jgi:hypothetical protein